MSFLKKYQSFNSRIFKFFLILSIISIIFSFKYMPTLCTGGSMVPTFKNPELILINKRAYTSESPKRFDIVAIFDPSWNENLIKRVVALPGEKLEIINGEFYINDTLLKFPFSTEKITNHTYCAGPVILPSNSYFYIGDARASSSMGIFLNKQLIGKVL